MVDVLRYPSDARLLPLWACRSDAQPDCTTRYRDTHLPRLISEIPATWSLHESGLQAPRSPEGPPSESDRRVVARVACNIVTETDEALGKVVKT